MGLLALVAALSSEFAVAGTEPAAAAALPVGAKAATAHDLRNETVDAAI